MQRSSFPVPEEVLQDALSEWKETTANWLDGECDKRILRGILELTNGVRKSAGDVFFATRGSMKRRAIHAAIAARMEVVEKNSMRVFGEPTMRLSRGNKVDVVRFNTETRNSVADSAIGLLEELWSILRPDDHEKVKPLSERQQIRVMNLLQDLETNVFCKTEIKDCV